MNSQKIITLAKTGVQSDYNKLEFLDSGFRRNDQKARMPTLYKTSKLEK